MSEGNDTAEPRLSIHALVPLLLVVVLAGWVWAPLLGLPFTGEDFVIFERLGRGEPAWLHVFRPLSGSWLGLLHGIFGADSPLPYHLGSLLLHLVNTCLVFLIGRELFGSRWWAAITAALFAINTAATDSLVWIAAVNRPWAGLGALLAYLGLLRLQRSTGLALALVVGGFLVAALSNEEVYGLTAVVVPWLAWTAWKIPALRKPAGACALLVAIAITVQFVLLQQVPGGSDGLMARGVSGALGTIHTRAAQMAEGIGLGFAFGLLIPVAGGVLLSLAGNRRAAALALAAWVGALIPFALSTASSYRAYPSLAPTAFLAAGGVLAVLQLTLENRGVDLSMPAFLVLVLAVTLETAEDRHDRILRWRRSLVELETCARDARVLAQEHATPPVLVNLELSSAGPFYYYFGIGDPHAIEMRGFLDAPSAYEEFGEAGTGWWYGRRLDGTYGIIEPSRYFERPVVEPLALRTVAIPVKSCEEARRLMTDPGIDLRSEALVEASSEELGEIGAPGELGRIEVLEPFEHEGNRASMTVRISVPAPRLFVYQDHWLYEFLYRTSPDQAVITDLAERRRVKLSVALREGNATLDTYFVNGFGLGCVVPSGEHVLELTWTLRPALKR